ncbi:acyl-CoA dehydrogenase family protein [Nocardia sp. NPDC050710]|uniref:acyl-CoA dehydrogenase family protein n=1 Tax=Nocardia sp. NPDC050710 TaxID=3157220 RepID=UPI0034066E03
MTSVETRADSAAPTDLGPYPAAAALEAALGDPRAQDNPFGFTAMLARAEQHDFPEALAEIAGPALRLSYIPAEHGGDLIAYDQTLMLVRVAARRDLTIMPATMIDITATLCVLLAGSPEQQDRSVRLLRSGRSIGFAFSEPAHGSDLLANTCALTPDPVTGGWILDGEKWLTGFGKHAGAMLVIAHTGGRGPAAYSMALVYDPLRQSSARYRLQRPAGMRGTDFAHFHFTELPVAEDAVVGRIGRGMETAMRAMQVVRATSTGANLAAVDSALRLTLGFARHHVVAGCPVDEHPINRRELGTAAAALLACDAAALACARSLHTFPAAQSLWSSLLKAVLTELSTEAFARCADVLGTRGVLREGPEGAFDVLRADNAVVRYFDTSPTANLRLVAMQLGRFSETGFTAGQHDALELLSDTFDLDAELPPLDLTKLALSARGLEVVTGGFPVAAAGMRAMLGAARPCTGRALDLIDRLERALAATRTDIAGLSALSTAERATAASDLALRIAYLHAAAVCVQLWWFNRARSLYGTAPGSVDWLLPALTLLLDRGECRTAPLPMALADNAFEVVARLNRDRRLFTARPLPLATEEGTEPL